MMKKIIVVGFFFLTTFLSGCATPKPGYKNTGFPFFSSEPEFPCADEKYSSKEYVDYLNAHLDGSVYKDIKVDSIVGLNSEDNKNRSLTNSYLQCKAVVLFSNATREDVTLRYDIYSGVPYQVEMDSDRLRSYKKARADEVRKKLDADFESQHPISEYPYLATASCTFMGNTLALFNCFTNRYDNTNFELRNGSDYKMYSMYDLIQGLGHSDGYGGEQLMLRSHFSISAQNDSDSAMLNLVIKDRASGQTVFQKSAGTYGYIGVKN